MEQEKQRVEKVLLEINKLLEKHSAVKGVLFGSWAKGTAHTGSDIDIAVFGVKDMDRLQEEAEELETLYRIDIVDMDTCGNELLKEDIAEYGRKIYEKI